MDADRHPEDSEPVRATKARAVWWLGLLATATGPFVGGLVPGSLALVLAAQFRREAYPAAGFLTGAALVRRGEWLAGVGIALSAVALVTAVVVGLFQAAGAATGGQFGPHID